MSPCVSILNIFKYFYYNFEIIKISCFHDWMVLDCDMWCNRNLSHGILI